MGRSCEKDLNVGKIYMFINFQYRVTNYGRYINSPKNLECNVEESDDFKENVAEIKLPSTLIEDNLTFMAIQKCSKSIICRKCSTRNNCSRSICQMHKVQYSEKGKSLQKSVVC